MKTAFTLNSGLVLGPKMDLIDADVRHEPMFFGASYDYAMQHGGPITREFLGKMPGLYRFGILDSRVHMLMPGWYPCIPGWHTDDVPRGGEANQPDYFTPRYKSRHACALVNGHLAPTEFLIGNVSLEIPQSGTVYASWHEQLERKLSSPDSGLTRWSLPSCQIVMFDWLTLHRGTPAVESGWRWFCRITINTERPIMNEIRNQVQVYMSSENAGW